MAPNIVLVTVDSLRADYCSFMGDGEPTTPTLDAMATEGTVFESAVAPGPSTPESMPAVFTGRYPTERVDPSNVTEARGRIRRHMETRETLPEQLSSRGYTTAGFTPNPYTSRYFGFDAGFDRFEDFSEDSVRTAGDGFLQRLSPDSDAVQAARMLINLVQREEVFKPWDAYVEDVVAWCDAADTPYFAWVHMMDPHVPYMAPAAYRHLSWWQTFRANVSFWQGDKEDGLDEAVLERLQTAYTDTVEYVDSFLARLRSDLGEDTSIVVHADHGEAFGEHETYGHEPYLYEENIHVPLVVSGVPSGSVAEPVSLRAVPSLLVQLAEDEWDPERLTSTFATSRTADSERVTVRGERIKCIRSPSGIELYDLKQGERDPLANEEVRELCQRRLERVDADLAEVRSIRNAVERLPRGEA
ncbi:MAG: sulfatase [Halobacteriota archaeon]